MGLLELPRTGTSTQPATPPAAVPRRIPAIDRQRGLIMALMALDHASAMVARHHATEMWAGALTLHGSALSFLTRFVTHLCAPGFFFLMGCGLEFFARARRAAGWSESRIARTLVTRGLLLVLINQLIENPAWIIWILTSPQPTTPQVIPGSGGMPFILTGVLTALGLSLVVCGLLRRLPSVAWVTIALGCLWATNALTPTQDRVAEAFRAWQRLLLIPGQTGPLLVMYPLVPWLPLAALGLVFARALSRASEKTWRVAPWVGVTLIAAAIALRAAGGFGNLRLPRDGSWIEFLNFVKYPPALVFNLFMLGLNLVLLGFLARAGERLQPLARWLEIFGRTPLFFYIAHLYLYSLAGAVLFRSPLRLELVYLVWLAGLVPLAWLCVRFEAFQQRRPVTSVWRLF